MDNAVLLKDVGKRYVKYEDVPLLVTRALRFRAAHKRSHLWAVRHVNVEVPHGESLGVIGRNGSGKSTMFQMLAGVTAPTEGRVKVSGRVAPLISVGIGFHPELTGRENVYVNGTILGLTKSEIDHRFDEILAFAGIEEFIDTPVKFYSSGMFVRLGFSVAVAAEPEVLLVDEVLAVGDLAFQLKCFDRMEQIRKSGATILVVSHNTNAIRRLCSKVLLLNQGEQVFLGDTDEGISMYHDILGSDALAEPGENASDVEVLGFDLVDESGNPTAHIQSGDEVTFRARIRFVKDTKSPVFGFRLHKDTGLEAYSENTAMTEFGPMEAGREITLRMKLKATLPTGSFTAHVLAFTGRHAGASRAKGQPIAFFVSGRPFVNGSADLGATFEIDSDGEPARSGARARKPRQPRGRMIRSS